VRDRRAHLRFNVHVPPAPAGSARSSLLPILLGGLVVGALDITEPMVFWHFRAGTAPARILQSVAGGLLGRATFNGGWKTAALGLGLHVFIATSVTTVFVLASRRWTLLTRRWMGCGVLYGLGVYVFMYYVVLPLSASGRPAFAWATLANALFAHTFCVGLPIAFIARRRPLY
jgi:hypothetical protein